LKNPRPILDTEISETYDSSMCFKLLQFLNAEPDSTASGSWEKMKEILTDGKCPYKGRCEVYARTIRKHPGTQQCLF